MALDRSNFALTSSSGNASAGIRMFSYTTADTTATVDTAGYFNGVADMLTVGDQIYAITSSGGTPSYERYHVNAVSGAGVVDVADSVPLDGASDTD